MKNLLLLAAAFAATAAFAMPGQGNANAPGATGTPHGAVPAPAKPVAKVAKAAGPDGRTVAEVVSGAAAHNGKTVSIQAQVVKVTSGVMGKNWLHLQDGSGAREKGTHDIVVTTQDAVQVGDIVTAKGTVKTDVDIGSGYKYAVLLADAKVRK